MQGWVAGFQKSIDYKHNLSETLDIEEIAGESCAVCFLLSTYLRRSVRDDCRRVYPCAQDDTGCTGTVRLRGQGD